jgi:hypothetical protein
VKRLGLVDAEFTRVGGGVRLGRVVRVPRCFGRVDGHERLSRARAGRTDANLLDVDGQVPLCSLHNEWMDSQSGLAAALGLSRFSDGRPIEDWRRESPRTR